MNLNGLSFQVSATATAGVVSSDTRLALLQRGSRIFGRYRGGSIQRGHLVGSIVGRTMCFRYSQRETAGGIHGGRSICVLEYLSDGRLRIREHFTWKTRAGAGVNIFDQVDAGHALARP
jgi:hypothetical protein